MADIIGNQTVRDLWEGVVRTSGNAPFLIFESAEGEVEEYSYRAFDEEINRAANAFLSLGVSKGSCVAVQVCSSPEFLMCLFGLAKIGALMVPVHDKASEAECAYLLQSCAACLAIVEPERVAGYQKIRGQQGCLSLGVVVARSQQHEAQAAGTQAPATQASVSPAAASQAPATQVSATEAAAMLAPATQAPVAQTCAPQAGAESVTLFFDELRAAQPTVLAQVRALNSEDPAEILFTSGTTAAPKGVVLTHCNLLFSGVYGVWQVSLRSDDRLLTTMPACHSNFQLAALMPVIAAGATLILIERYSASRFWRQIRHYRATVTQCVSMMVRTLLMQPPHKDDQNHCLREVLYFLPLTPAEKQDFEKRYAVRLMNTYGSTESIAWVLTDPPHGERRWPSVGRVGLGYEVCVVDEQGSELAPGEVGEFWIKGVPGRTLMAGYYQNPQATAEVLGKDGWLKTGDKGYQDKDGWFYFVDRKANLIKRAGENISASEIEEVLMAHPLIKEAAVIGVPDALRDQAVKAFVVLRPGTALNEAEVLAYCGKQLASYKVPSVVEIRASLPHTRSMKVEKCKLS